MGDAHMSDEAYDQMAADLVAGLVKVQRGIELLSDPELLAYGPVIVDRLEQTAQVLPPMSTRARVVAFTEEGRTPREIAGLLGVSTQAVYQHLKKLGGEQ